MQASFGAWRMHLFICNRFSVSFQVLCTKLLDISSPESVLHGSASTVCFFESRFEMKELFVLQGIFPLWCFSNLAIPRTAFKSALAFLLNRSIPGPHELTHPRIKWLENEETLTYMQGMNHVPRA